MHVHSQFKFPSLDLRTRAVQSPVYTVSLSVFVPAPLFV